MSIFLTRKNGRKVLAVLAVALLMGGCGGSSHSTPAPPPLPTPPVTLLSIAVTPGTLATGVGIRRHVLATGTFSDGSKADLGTTAIWTQLAPSVATVASGVVTGVTPGSTTIRVASAGIAADVPLNVTSDAWTPAATMLRTLSVFPLTLLPNGKVLASGGDALSGDAEIYNPDEDSWLAAGLNVVRVSHTATLLASGKILVAGGLTHSHSDTTSITYDPVSGAWSTGLPSMLAGRSGHTATLLPDGRVLVAGGATFPFPALPAEERYDPATNAWSAVQAMLSPRTLHTATLLPSGKVLVVGGYTNPNSTVASAETYDPGANSWSAAASMSVARNGHTATLLSDGTVLVVGGQASTSPPYTFLASAEIYHPQTDSWKSAGAMASARSSHAALALPNGKVLVIGGAATLNGALASAELYDPASNTWSPAASMANARSVPAATLLKDGSVLVCGGNVGGAANCEFYW